ncbi:MAG: hypothetical protein HWN66_07810, partial [Candidatus Helarchaeota archaeon]|nr:hypothetical protein [Candidatus Helarchaeota archaeon]
MRKIWKKIIILLFVICFGMSILVGTHLNRRAIEFSSRVNTENQNLVASTARYDIEQLFQFEENQNYYSFELQDDYLYVTAREQGIGPKLTIFNVTVPTAMTKISTFPTNDTLRDLDVKGNFAYIVTETEGLMVVNVSDPTSPQKVGTFFDPNITGAYIIEVVDTFAYVISNEWDPFFSIINITAADPQNFTLVSGNDCITGSASDLEIADDFAYICGGWGSGWVEVYNISDPSSATYLTDFHGGNKQGMAIKIEGNLAYIASGIHGFFIYNITNPLSPGMIGTFSDFGFSNDIEIRSNFAFIADGYDGLEVIDISNPTSPQKVGSFTNDKYFRFFQVSNETIYVLRSQDGMVMEANGISILKVEYNVLHPKSIVQVQTGTIETLHLELKDDLLFIADHDLDIYNVSDPSNPIF